MFSIRRYLLVTLLAVATISMTVTAWLSYREAVHEVEELFDAQLAQSARVLVATLTTHPLVMEEAPGDTVVFPVWRPIDGGDNGESGDEVRVSGHKYETRLFFQLWEGAGERLLMRSSNAPQVPLAEFRAGYGRLVRDGEPYHVFSVEHEGLWLQVAQDDYMRGELATEIALAAFLPHAAGIPLMALLIWLLVARGLRPIDALRRTLAGRDVGHLAPVEVQPSSIELRPVISELNSLLDRLHASFERERRFTADAAHELRTPLAVLRIHVENARCATDDAERQAALDGLLRGVDRATRLVEQLLTLARVEPVAAAAKFVPLRLDALVREELADLVRVAERRGQELAFEADGEFEVSGDRDLLGVLLRNLVDNALRYSPDGSLVRVRLERVGNERVRLVVLDEGPGVPPAQAERIFERFYRGNTGRGDGAGLGLAIVSRIVELHAGRVRVRPRAPGADGGFEVELPVSGTAAARGQSLPL